MGRPVYFARYQFLVSRFAGTDRKDISQYLLSFWASLIHLFPETTYTPIISRKYQHLASNSAYQRRQKSQRRANRRSKSSCLAFSNRKTSQLRSPPSIVPSSPELSSRAQAFLAAFVALRSSATDRSPPSLNSDQLLAQGGEKRPRRPNRLAPPHRSARPAPQLPCYLPPAPWYPAPVLRSRPYLPAISNNKSGQPSPNSTRSCCYCYC